MRVVAGMAKGRRLTAPKGDATRPTSDFVREAVFNTLASHLDVEGATVVDLFAGTGALGIEAMSRGAASAVFVERDRRAVAAIRANLAATGLGSAEVHQAEAVRWLAGSAGRYFDIAFADPPYTWEAWPALLGRLAAGLAVLESDREVEPAGGWRVLKVKRYGSTVVTLITPQSHQ